jgi:hypothetical protein
MVAGDGLVAAARKVLAGSEVAVETAASLVDATACAPYPDLVVLDAGVLPPGDDLGERIASCGRAFSAPVLGVGAEHPGRSVLDRVAAFLVEPYTESELVTAFAELLGTHVSRAPRRGVAIPARLSLAGRARPLAVIVRQLSKNGCAVESDVQVAVGTEVELRFVLPSNQERITLSGQVVSGNELQLIYGIRFAAEHGLERLAIQVFVELGSS